MQVLIRRGLAWGATILCQATFDSYAKRKETIYQINHDVSNGEV